MSRSSPPHSVFAIPRIFFSSPLRHSLISSQSRLSFTLHYLFLTNVFFLPFFLMLKYILSSSFPFSPSLAWHSFNHITLFLFIFLCWFIVNLPSTLALVSHFLFHFLSPVSQLTSLLLHLSFSYSIPHSPLFLSFHSSHSLSHFPPSHSFNPFTVSFYPRSRSQGQAAGAPKPRDH